MSNLDNENVLRVYGYGTGSSTSDEIGVSLVLPLHLNGSLDAYLYDYRPVSETIKTSIVSSKIKSCKLFSLKVAYSFVMSPMH